MTPETIDEAMAVANGRPPSGVLVDPATGR